MTLHSCFQPASLTPHITPLHKKQKTFRKKETMLIKCKYCGKQHKLKKEECPAFGKTCLNCKGRNHFSPLKMTLRSSRKWKFTLQDIEHQRNWQLTMVLRSRHMSLKNLHKLMDLNMSPVLVIQSNREAENEVNVPRALWEKLTIVDRMVMWLCWSWGILHRKYSTVLLHTDCLQEERGHKCLLPDPC